jgi:hypothetical protein
VAHRCLPDGGGNTDGDAPETRVDKEVVQRQGNDGVQSSRMMARRSTVVGGGLQNRRECGNEEGGFNS